MIAEPIPDKINKEKSPHTGKVDDSMERLLAQFRSTEKTLKIWMVCVALAEVALITGLYWLFFK
ncbi:MAG: hypothetical protein ACLFUU_12710 [Desulfobacteraceae bacterium]